MSGVHYDDVTMGAKASQITSLTIVYSNFYSGADQSKYQSSALLAFVWGIHRGPVNSPHKWPVTRKMFPFWWRHHVYGPSHACLDENNDVWLVQMWRFTINLTNSQSQMNQVLVTLHCRCWTIFRIGQKSVFSYELWEVDAIFLTLFHVCHFDLKSPLM